MKIIDLLNKIANGEEVSDFKYKECNFTEFNTSIHNNTDGKWVEIKIGNDKWEVMCRGFLNDEVEILEEEKKLPEKLEYYDDSIAWVIDDVGQLSDVDKVIIDKLNDLIDYLKSKGE